MNENYERGPHIPDELQDELRNVLTKLSIFIHSEAGMSHLILEVKHVSDALSKSGITELRAAVGGLSVRRADGTSQPANPAQATAMVDDLLAQMMSKAKEKGAEKPKPEPEGE